VLALSAAIAFVAIVLVMTLSKPRESEHHASAPPTDTPAHDRVPDPVPPPPPVNILQAPPPPPPPPPVATTVHVRISATPQNAQMFLDGDPIGNPFEADVPRDPEQVEHYHLLRVAAPGYQTLEQDLVFHFDNMSYPIELQRGRPDRVVHLSVTGQAVQQPRPIVPVHRPLPSQERGNIFGTGARPVQPLPPGGERRAIFGH
jgi:hypothetical protein